MSAVPDLPAVAPIRHTRRGEQTAERILDAAEALFAERGYAGTTLRDVAALVGLRNPSLYNHFPNKESLYAAVLERGIRPLLEALADFMAAGAARSGDSGRLIERMMKLLRQRPDLPRLVQHETLAGGEHLTPMLRAWIQPVFEHAHETIEAGPAAKRWTPEQIPLLVLALYHIVVGYFTIAPLYEDLNGADLLSRPALEEQTRFLSQVVETLLPGEG
jgi:AcrR family transcriptional regulator